MFYAQLERSHFQAALLAASGARSRLRVWWSQPCQRLADRWIGDIEIGDSHRRLGLRRPWWTIPVSILFFVVLGLTLSLTCVGMTAIFEGSFDLPLAVWIGMAVWFILIGSIIFLYRRLWLR
jgi:hypothetical protein